MRLKHVALWLTRKYFRALAEEDIEDNGQRSIAEAAGEAAVGLYRRGDVASSKLPSLNAWLTKEKCMFPDVIESLALGHLQKGDQMSAMITSEWQVSLLPLELQETSAEFQFC